MTEPAIPATVDIREVGPRDGLQLEAPLAFAKKVALLEALAATGARRIEATAFVSPRAVPSMADAEKVGEVIANWPEVEWSALVASPNGARRAVDAGFTRLEYVVSAADSHSRANSGRPTRDALEATEKVSESVHSVGGHLEVIIATAWDCPFDERTPSDRTVDAGSTRSLIRIPNIATVERSSSVLLGPAFAPPVAAQHVLAVVLASPSGSSA